MTHTGTMSGFLRASVQNEDPLGKRMPVYADALRVAREDGEVARGNRLEAPIADMMPFLGAR